MLTSCSQTDTLRGSNDLRICLRKEPASLDPRKGNDVLASQVHYLLFEGLVCLHPDMTIVPGVAESYECSSDGKTYTFHMRESCWSDGSLVTAYDFEKA